MTSPVGPSQVVKPDRAAAVANWRETREGKYKKWRWPNQTTMSAKK